MRIELLRDYRGIKINDELWLKGIYEVADDLGTYLIGKSYARVSNEPLPQPPVAEPPDGIKAHNKAVKDLGLPSHSKVQPATVQPYPASDELVGPKEDQTPYSSPSYSRAELLEIARESAIEVEGTGKDGRITKQDLVDALEGDGS